MIDVITRLEEDLKEATLARDGIRLDVVRMLKSALKNYQIEVGRELTNDQILTVIQKEAKKRRDAKDAYEKNNRPELADQEGKELQILADYLPEQLSDDDINDSIARAIIATGAKELSDTGRVMNLVMKETAGRADGAKVSELVKAKLS